MSSINSVLSVLALYDRPCTKGELVMQIARMSNVCYQDMEQLKRDVSRWLLESVRYGYMQKKDGAYCLMPLDMVTKCQHDVEVQLSMENAMGLGSFFDWSNANSPPGNTVPQLHQQPTPQSLPNLIDVQKRSRLQPAKKGTGGQALKKPGPRLKTRKAKLRTKAAVKKAKTKLKIRKTTIKRTPGAKNQKKGRLSKKPGKR